MLTRFLLIGVGGSGGTTLRYCWRELERKLKAAGWQEGMPTAWQFLHVDVAEQPDGIEGDVPVDVGMKFLGLAPHQKSYRDFDRDLVTFDSTVLPALVGWRPDPRGKYAQPSNGAGQRRVVGRVVTVVEIDRIGEAIEKAVGAMMTAEADDQLRKLNGLMGKDVTGEIDGNAAVISSLAGGSGSGAFLDVIALLKSLASTQQKQWLSNNLVTVLYSAEVFSRLPSNHRQGTEPNSLAALAEFLNAAEHEDHWPEMESKLLARGGGTGSIEGSRVAQANFIIGSKNGNVNFPTTFDVYRSVGKAFSAFMTSPSVQEKFNSVVITNVGPEKLNPSFGICDLAPDYLPCSSFGYANVSLGRSLFSTYASERLAKRSLERLLRGHREGLTGENLKRDETLITERVERFKDEFFESAGLREETIEHNEVLDALRDPEQDAAMKGFSGEVADRFRSDTTSRPPLEAMQVFTKFFDSKAEKLLEQQRGVRHARAIEWVDAIQTRLEEATASALGEHGFPVTIKLLEALEQQLKRAARELERDAAAADADQGKLIGAADGLFRSLVDKVKAISTQHQNFPEANKKRREALVKRIDEELFGFAAGLIDSLVAELLPPMVQALQNAQTTLAKAEEAAEKQIQQWSSDALPNHLRAAPNEVLLEPQDAHPQEYLRQMARAFELAPEGAESAALREVISGAWIKNEGERMAQRLISRASEWAPRLGIARSPSAASSRPKFKLYLTPDLLEREAEDWVKSRNGLFADYVNCSLASWLSGEHPDHAERAGRFARGLHQALNMSEPLVSINTQVYLEVHGQDPPRPQRVIGQIPLPPGHPARPAVEEALRAAGIDESEFSRFFDPAAPGEEVPISSFGGVRMHPVVFDSVTAPIQKDWQNRTDEQSRTHFWKFRRSRGLRSFVPLSPARQEALVRGWLTAIHLGQVTELKGSWNEDPLKIWTPGGHRKFPDHLLRGNVTDPTKVLPALMESFPLAMIAYGNANYEQLWAYLRLLEIGQPSGEPSRAYLHANSLLADWVRAGEMPSADPGKPEAPLPPPTVAGLPEDDPRERARLLSTGLREFERDYRTTVGAERVTEETTLTLGPTWEIWELVCEQAIVLADAIDVLATAPPRQGEGGFTKAPSSAS